MLHLSLLTLSGHSSRWMYLQPYHLHQLLWKGFPGVPRNTGKTYFLYRYDQHDAGHNVLVQSVIPPDWSRVDAGNDELVTQVKEFAPDRIPAGTQLNFFVRANPVVRRKGYEDRVDRKRHGRHIVVGSNRALQAVRMGKELKDVPAREEQLVQWLQQQGAQGGFDIAADTHDRPCVTVGPNHDVMVGREKGSQPMTFTTVDFDGILVVRDPTAFAQTVANGIGRGKAFGFGLLSVNRA